MPEKLGPILIEFVLDKKADEQAKNLKHSLDAINTSTQKASAGVVQYSRNVRSWSSDINKQTSEVNSSITRIGQAVGAYLTFNTLQGFTRSVVEIRGQFQQLGIAFETMLGSKEKADALMQEAVSFASKTPFTLEDVATNVKQLMAMGIATENVMTTMKSLGDVAAGVSVPISRIAVNYGQVATLGTLQGRELRDFAMAGIPLMDELAKNMGKTKAEIDSMVTAGQIGFPLVEEAFRTMAGEGGKFYNLMEKQNASVTGQLSNLTDKWQIMLNEIGKSNEGAIYGGIKGVTNLITNYKDVIEVIKGLIAVLGAAKVATLAVSYYQGVQAEAALVVAGSTDVQTLAEGRSIVMKQRAAAAQTALNESMLANPYVLAAAAIAAVGFAIYKLVTYQSELEKSVNKAQTEIENEKDKALDLFTALKLAKEGTDEWKNARKAIIDQYGDYIPAQLQEMKGLDQIGKAQQVVNKLIEDNIALRVKKESQASISAEYNPEIIKATDKIVDALEKSGNKDLAAKAKYQLAKLVEAYKVGVPDAEKKLDEYRIQLAQAMGKISEDGLAKDFKSARINAMFAGLESTLHGLRTETELNNKAFEDFSKGVIEISAGPTIKTPKYENAAAQRKQVMAELEAAEKKLKEIEMAPGDDPLKAIAEQKAAIKALKDQLDLKDNEDADRSKRKLAYETEAGRRRIENEIDIQQGLIDAMADGAQRSRAQAELDHVKRLNDLASYKADQLKAYNEANGGIDAKTGLKTKAYTDQLPIDDQLQIDKLIVNSENKKAAAIEAINKKEVDDLKKLQDEILDYRLSGIEKEKRAVKQKYDELARLAREKDPGNEDVQREIEQLRKKANAEIDNKYALDQLDFQEQIENRKAAISTNNEEELQKKLFEIWARYQRAKINALRNSTDPKDVEQAAIMQADLDAETKNYGLEQEDKLRKSILSSATRLVEGVRQFNGGLADSLGLALNLGDTLSKAFRGKEMSKEDAASSIIGGAIDMISMFANQAQENKRVMREYYASIISQQQQYNLLLNEQLRLNSDVEGSVFLTDFVGRIKDGALAFNDAQEKYQEGLQKFKDSEAITGQKSVVSGNNVLKGAGAGAAIGAGVGSFVPVIGTAIGAAVGGIVGALAGLFAKKKKDIVAPLLSTYPDLIKANGEFNSSLAQTLIDNNKVTEETKATLKNLIEWKKAADQAKEQIKQVVADLAGSLGDDLRNSLVKAFEEGTSSAIAFGDSVNKVLENILSNMIFNKVFEGSFKLLEDQLGQAIGTGDENAVTQVFTDFFKKMPELTELFNKQMESAKTAAGQSGIDIFNPGESSQQNNSSMTGTIKGITEETASVLAGQVNAIRIAQAMANNTMQSSILQLVKIENNTSYCRYLESIDKRLGDLKNSDSLRSTGNI
jgi:tape measure domain-containing protein